ncbi:hypothetical protein [Shouchella lonarensis]|uniref:Uncharacterized protein n=1 Tax=Shouchella lonarensis TaxID=1464122 RepID=A0A1G6HM36_9BACI|nr:hypothetical protein [Shouchella lonarensis]SDB95367.1 hypothetical protein SAMN05421737_10475 [Shouchella lonarensis]
MKALRLFPGEKNTEFEIIEYEYTTLKEKKKMVGVNSDGTLGWRFIDVSIMFFYDESKEEGMPTIDVCASDSRQFYYGSVIFVGFDNRGLGLEGGLDQNQIDYIIKSLIGSNTTQINDRTIPRIETKEDVYGDEIMGEEIIAGDEMFL